MIGESPITPEHKEKLKKQFEREEIKDFQLKNIQVVQTFRIMDNPINFVTNHFRVNNELELKETNFIENEMENVITDKNEINDNNIFENNKNISVSEKLKQQIYFFKNLLIHRDKHFCKKEKHISEEILKQEKLENVEALNKMTNATQNFLLNITKEIEKNKKDITKLIGNIHKNFNAGSELELLDSKQQNNNINNINNAK